MRMKVFVPEFEDFNQFVHEIVEVAPVHLQSERRRFVATEDLPAEVRADLIARGATIVPDERYDLDFE